MIENLLKDILNTGRWQTTKEVLDRLKHHEIHLNDRSLRKHIEIYNDRYHKGITDTYIAYSSKGYILTTKDELIYKTAKRERARAMASFRKYRSLVNKLKDKDQLSLNITNDRAELLSIVKELEA